MMKNTILFYIFTHQVAVGDTFVKHRPIHNDIDSDDF